jgi:tRNA-Thr(GGU) m(6)t(6)A37 methyltransferase TsaA
MAVHWNDPDSFDFQPIGFVQSCFKEKFGIPRQPGLATHATGVVKLRDDSQMKNALQGLEMFSHLWIIFVFHDRTNKKWKPSIRPPRLGGARKVGVLASRSPHRPNPIGLSAVALQKIDVHAKGGPEIFFSSGDLLDGTPVLDIKPYIPYADSLPQAHSGWADSQIERISVEFDPIAETKLQQFDAQPELRTLIIELLSLDPRPAFQQRQRPAQSLQSRGMQYGFRVFDVDVKWEIRNGTFAVLDLVPMSPEHTKPAPTLPPNPGF